ncbi:putative Ig domain-containing protein [Petrocella atlantisensis]|uniref:Putative Ig domain-containing protein n=1 Tax=Petrocella atlantisensis TaxID=2173034 RepID=A0A3P7NW10_9FIRM|nr:hypothetical protein [Petrocella atlantisensis]VDN47105.1 putative Ig domain-containing protein [Petrocella atlantisensis]
MRKKRFLSLVLVLTLMLTSLIQEGLPVYAASDPSNFIFDISEGGIAVSAGTDADTIKVAYGIALELDNIPKIQEITIIGTTTGNKVVVDGVLANITIDTVDIQHSSGFISAFELINAANVTLTLEGSNILKSNSNFAGMGVGIGQSVTIKGTGSLTATGGNYGAGIGGGNNGAGGIITIEGGTVNAAGGLSGAGIGGGYYGAGGDITISGGTVTATGGNNGAGIGGGTNRSGGDVIISGGTVTATGGRSGSGIGGGSFGAGGNIAILGGDVFATAGEYGGGIGAGFGESSGFITIFEEATVIAVSQESSAAIKTVNGTLEDASTANIMMASFVNAQTANTSVQIRSDGITYSFIPTVDYRSIARTVLPNNTYQVKANDILQSHSYGLISDFTDFIIQEEKLKVFSNLVATPDSTSVELIEAAIYTMTQAEAIDEAAVKTAIEDKIVTLALDGVSTSVTKVLYTPAIVGDSGTPDGTDGTYTFTVDLTKGSATATTAVLTMTITATTYDEELVATVKGLVEGAPYTITQAEATDEAVVKTAIEDKIATLALDGVLTSVTKVLYTPAIAGDAGTPDGINGTYTFTVDLSKGAAEDTTATLTMTVTATGFSGSGGGGSTKRTQPSQDTVIVIVNGKEEDVGKQTNTTEDGKSTVVIEVVNSMVESKIDEAIKNNITPNGNVIQIPIVDTKSEVAKVELMGNTIKKLEESIFNISIKRDTVEYIIPAEEFAISKIAENLGLRKVIWKISRLM